MKLKMYAIKDRATEQYDRPLYFLSAGQANRAFTDEINRADGNNAIYQHPDDYDMYDIGEFNTDTGETEGKKPELMTRGKDVKIKQ